MKKYSTQEKVDILVNYIKNPLGISEYSSVMNISQRTVSTLINEDDIVYKAAAKMRIKPDTVMKKYFLKNELSRKKSKYFNFGKGRWKTSD